jgi:hypothetical protein
MKFEFPLRHQPMFLTIRIILKCLTLSIVLMKTGTLQ